MRNKKKAEVGPTTRTHFFQCDSVVFGVVSQIHGNYRKPVHCICGMEIVGR